MSFDTDTALDEFCKCVFKLHKSLCTIGSRSKSNKRIRFEQDRLVKEKFKDTVRASREKFINVTKVLFSRPPDDLILETIARDTMQSLSKVKAKFKIEEEHYRLVIDSTIIPIIKTLMEEEELNKLSSARQESRKQFIKQLLLASFEPKSLEHEQNHHRSHNSSGILRESSSENLPDNRVALVTPDGDLGAQDAFMICDVLFDALVKHTEAITSDDSDYTPRIFHIINITHVVDIIQWYFRRIKESYDKDIQTGYAVQRPFTDLLSENLLKYRTSVDQNLAKFEPDNPLTIFQMELKSILVQLLTLQCLIKK